MSKFQKLYEEIFKPADKQEKERRDNEKWSQWIKDETKKGKLKQNPDGSYDYDGNLDFSYKKLTKIPIKFNKISGSFVCSINEITSLKGCPKEVGKHFNCGGNKLTSLHSAPKEVGGDFSCSYQINGHKFTIDDVKKVCDVKGDIYV